MTRRQPRRKASADYDAANLVAAHIILRDPHHHCAGLVQWAEAVIRRIETERAAKASDDTRDRGEAPCCDLD
jgi:hypothetical protein